MRVSPRYRGVPRPTVRVHSRCRPVSWLAGRRLWPTFSPRGKPEGQWHPDRTRRVQLRGQPPLGSSRFSPCGPPSSAADTKSVNAARQTRGRSLRLVRMTALRIGHDQVRHDRAGRDGRPRYRPFSGLRGPHARPYSLTPSFAQKTYCLLQFGMRKVQAAVAARRHACNRYDIFCAPIGHGGGAARHVLRIPCERYPAGRPRLRRCRLARDMQTLSAVHAADPSSDKGSLNIVGGPDKPGCCA